MVIGYHLIWTAYGCWLPNDPRGSCSHEIRVPEVVPLGPLHHGRKREQPCAAAIRAFYRQAEEVLVHARLTFDDEDIALIGASFAETIRERGFTCYGCAVMWDHVHLLIRRHRDKAEEMIEFFQNQSKKRLIEAGRRPVNHPVWGGPGWKVFLSRREEMVRVARYIRENPIKAGWPEQHWEFVKEYDGWLPRPAKG